MSLYDDVMRAERRSYLIPVFTPKAEPMPVKVKTFTESGFNKLPPPDKSRDVENPRCKRMKNQPRKHLGRCDYLKLVKKHYGFEPFNVGDVNAMGDFCKATPSQLAGTGHLRYLEMRKGDRSYRKSVMQWTGKEWTFRGETTVGSEVKGEKK